MQRQLVCCDWWVGGDATWLWCSEQRDSASGAVAQSGRSAADAETSQQGEPALVVLQLKGSTLPSTDRLSVCSANTPLEQRKCKMWHVLFNVRKKLEVESD